MSRTYFPTRNEMGVRDLAQSVTLGAYLYDDYHGPAEPAAKAAMNPVTLGIVFSTPPIFSPLRPYVPPPMTRPTTSSINPTTAAQTAGTPVPAGYSQNTPFIASDGSQWEFSSATGKWTNVGTPYNLAAPSVSSQTTPTPQVTVPPAPAQRAIYVSSGGGTASPAPAPAAVAPVSASVTDQVAGWLSGSTSLFGFNMPNALLAGGVVLGFAMLHNSGGRKR